MRFLVVDDDDTVCQGMIRRIHNMNDPNVGQVLFAHSGEEALTIALATPIDILVTDIQMYDMDGIGLIESLQGAGQDVSCVILTAYKDFEYAQSAVKLGVKDFLLKPVTEQRMRETLLDVIAKRKAHRQQQRLSISFMLEHALSLGEPIDALPFAKAGLAPLPTCFRAAMVKDAYPENAYPQPRCWHLALPNAKVLLIDGTDDSAVDAWVAKCQEETGKKVLLSLTRGDMASVTREVSLLSDKHSRDPVARAQAYVCAHVLDNIDMAMVANELNLSYSYFSHLYKKSTGRLFSDYILEVKMHKARELLMEGKSITQVAYALYYQSVQNFARAFRNYWGTSPGRTRPGK